jgi:glycosyltransferase involved in cell wall biosynthesis
VEVSLHQDQPGLEAAPPTSCRTAVARRRVLYVVTSFEIGGTEHQVAEMSCRLPADRYELTVCCLRAEGPFLEKVQQAGIPVREFSPGGTMLSPRALAQILRLAAFLRRQRFQVVHAHDLWSGLMAVPAARLAGVPLVISSRRDLGHLPWYAPRWRRRILRLVQRLSHLVVANSKAVQEMLVAGDGLARERIRVLYNGVDFARFASATVDRRRLFPDIPEGQRIVAVVANMHSAVKGHAVLIDAAHKLRGLDPPPMFMLVGDGELRPELERRVAALGLQAHFRFGGERQDIPQLLRACDLFVLPSIAEGMPNSVLEAMAAGLPVIATRAGGIGEIIQDGVTGVLVEPKSADALAAAMLRLLRDPDLAARLARAAQEHVRRNFSFDALIRRLGEMYGLMPHS